MSTQHRRKHLALTEKTNFDTDSYFAGGKMAYGAIDAIGGKMSPRVVASIRKSGTYMLYGALDPSSVSASNSDLLANTQVLPVGCMTSRSWLLLWQIWYSQVVYHFGIARSLLCSA